MDLADLIIDDDSDHLDDTGANGPRPRPKNAPDKHENHDNHDGHDGHVGHDADHIDSQEARTAQSDADFEAIRAGYIAKHDEGNLVETCTRRMNEIESEIETTPQRSLPRDRKDIAYDENDRRRDPIFTRHGDGDERISPSKTTTMTPKLDQQQQQPQQRQPDKILRLLISSAVGQLYLNREYKRCLEFIDTVRGFCDRVEERNRPRTSETNAQDGSTVRTSDADRAGHSGDKKAARIHEVQMGKFREALGRWEESCWQKIG